MFDVILGLLLLLGYAAMNFTFGVYATMDELRRHDNDLYRIWMDRRDARKGRK